MLMELEHFLDFFLATPSTDCTRHVHYLGRTNCSATWITMVRHPVDWIVSRFRFAKPTCLSSRVNLPNPRYDRRPSASSRRYSELLSTGVVSEITEEEWREKDLSACILAADPECLPQRGKVAFTLKDL